MPMERTTGTKTPQHVPKGCLCRKNGPTQRGSVQQNVTNSELTEQQEGEADRTGGEVRGLSSYLQSKRAYRPARGLISYKLTELTDQREG